MTIPNLITIMRLVLVRVVVVIAQERRLAAQIVLAATILGMRAFGLGLGDRLHWGVGSVAALTVLSAAAYLARGLRHMSET